jgi:hypothetical protein
MQDTGYRMQDRNDQDSGHRIPGTGYPAPMPNFPTPNVILKRCRIHDANLMGAFFEV